MCARCECLFRFTQRPFFFTATLNVQIALRYLTITKQQKESARDRHHESTATTTADGRARVRATRRRLTARLFTRRLQTREDVIEASTDGDTTVVFSASENETENGDASDAHQQTNERFDGRRVSS